MASGYTIFNSFNKKSVANMDKTSRARFRTEDILISDIYSNDKNFYDQRGIEEKADEILAVGLLSNLVVSKAPAEDGTPYKLISGERRWRALNLLVQRGFDEFKTVTCQVRNHANEHEEMIELILANSAREKDVATLIREEQTLKQELQYMRDNGMKLNGYDLQNGKLRDIVASMLNVSKTKIAEIDAVSNRLLPEFKEALETEKITFSAAYQISKLNEADQITLYEKYERAGSLTYVDVMAYADAFKKMREEELKKAQIPGQISIGEDVEASESDNETEAPEREEPEKSVVEPEEEDTNEAVPEEEPNLPEAEEDEAAEQAKMDRNIMKFYRITLNDEEREMLHSNNTTALKLRLLEKFSTSYGQFRDGYDFEWSKGKCNFNTLARDKSRIIIISLHDVIKRIIELLQLHPKWKIYSAPAKKIDKTEIIPKEKSDAVFEHAVLDGMDLQDIVGLTSDLIKDKEYYATLAQKETDYINKKRNQRLAIEIAALKQLSRCLLAKTEDTRR